MRVSSIARCWGALRRGGLIEQRGVLASTEMHAAGCRADAPVTPGRSGPPGGSRGIGSWAESGRSPALPFGARSFHHTPMCAAPQDYYDTLGVSRDAKAGDIKRAFYEKAKKYHPDTNKDDPQAQKKFLEIQKAYETLKDDQKRSLYDQMGADGYENMENGGGGGGDGPFGGFGGGDGPFGGFGGFGGGGGGGGGPENMEDVFRSFFGEGMDFGGGRGDVEVTLNLSFMEAVRGVSKLVTYQAQGSCEPCGGSGSKPGTAPSRCGDCRGSGRVTMRSGLFAVQTECPRCGGQGKVISDPCRSCGGRGRMMKDKTVDVVIPPGVDSGSILRVAGEGAAGGGRGKRAGDLLVALRVMGDQVFRRDGADVHVDVPVSIAQAALGSKVTVPTLDGDVTLTVQEGTQPGTKQVIRGKGIRRLQAGGRGDQFVHITVQVPKRVSGRRRELLEELAELDRELEVAKEA